MLVIIALKGKESKVTSDFLASSVGVNPVIIRKTLSQLKKAELISVARGTGGAEIIKNLEDISLLDIYQAVECLGKTGQLFSCLLYTSWSCSPLSPALIAIRSFSRAF